MKRRMFCILLAIVLLLCGCGGTAADTTAGNTSDPGAIDYHQNVIAQMPEVPVYEGELQIPYDPDRQVYISLSNQDCDFYPDTGIGVTYLSFWVITLERYDASQIQVKIPSQTEYEVTVFDASEECADTHHNINKQYAMSRDQYMCMLQLDWLERANQSAYWSTAFNLAQEYPKDSEEYKGYMALTEGSSERTIEDTARYHAVTKEELPQFYAYRVSICFTGLGSHDEVVESLEVQLGESSHRVDFGQWRLHAQTPQDFLDIGKREGIAGGGSLEFLLPGLPYDGSFTNQGFRFTALEDLTVTGARLLETGDRGSSVLGARVQLWNKDWDELLMEYLWDTKTPLRFAAGENVIIDLCVQDDRLLAYEVGFTAYLFLDYTVRNKEYSMLAECLWHRRGEPWDIYLMAFEGIDIGEYYTYYNLRAYQWFDDLPEEWLNEA